MSAVGKLFELASGRKLLLLRGWPGCFEAFSCLVPEVLQALLVSSRYDEDDARQGSDWVEIE
jgi:hypothetical protein